MAGARLHRAEPGAPRARPTKGGAVRIRIALATAVAVTLITAVIFALTNSSPVASAKGVRHWGSPSRAQRRRHHRSSVTRHETDVVCAGSEVGKVGHLLQRSDRSQEENYLKEVAYLKALQAQSSRPRNWPPRPRHSVRQHNERRPSRPAARSQLRRPVAAPAGSGSDASSTNTPDWACIRQHESGGNYGRVQRRRLPVRTGDVGRPDRTPPRRRRIHRRPCRTAAALRLFAERGWEPWTTRFVCGL